MAIDTLETVFTLNARQYQAGAAAVVNSTQAITGGIGRSLGVVTGFAAKLVSLPALLAGGLFAKMGTEASGAANDLEALMMGLTSVAGSSEEAQRQFERLKEVAKLPGLGLEEAVRGSVALQSTGLSANLAERAIKGFGNALATVGKGKADLEGVLTALGQIQSKGKISAEEINQIAERVPQIRKLTKAAFGTSDSEALQGMGLSSEAFIRGIVEQLEKLPRVAGGGKNVVENLGDSWRAAMASIGASINKWAMPALQKVGDFLGYLANSGILAKVTAGFGGMFGGDLGDTLVNGLAWVVATVKNIPAMVKAMAEGMAGAFRYVAEHAGVLAAVLGGIFLGGSILKGIEMLIAGFKALRLAIQSAGIASVIMEAIATGGVSLAKTMAGFLAGAAAGVGILKAMNMAFDGIKGPNIGDLPGFDQIAKDQAEIMKGMRTNAGNGDPLGDPADGPANPGDAALVETAKNTRDLVGLTRKKMDLEAAMNGGGELARLRVTPTELADAGYGRSSGSKGLDLIVQGVKMHTAEMVASRATSRARNDGRGLY